MGSLRSSFVRSTELVAGMERWWTLKDDGNKLERWEGLPTHQDFNLPLHTEEKAYYSELV
jgi:hypothetical protein